MSFVAARPSASAPSDGSRTITIRDSQPREEGTGSSSGEDSGVGMLRLRGAPRTRDRNRPRVVWREDVVDNEHAGKKSSKSLYICIPLFMYVTDLAHVPVCCIYHKPKRFDESSSEESSSDSDSDSDCGHDHHPRRGQRATRENPASRGDGSNMRSRDSAAVVHELHDQSNEVNRYERAPKRKGKKPMGRNDCEFSASFADPVTEYMS
jgi:protein phosphatase 1 regulatory subunit 11